MSDILKHKIPSQEIVRALKGQKLPEAKLLLQLKS